MVVGSEEADEAAEELERSVTVPVVLIKHAKD